MEILHRAKRKDNNQWVEGFYYSGFQDKSIGFILCAEDGISYEIIPTTVGVFSTIHDLKGDRIFEDDLITFRGGKKPRGQQRPFVISRVIFRNGMFVVENNTSVWIDYVLLPSSTKVGNIFDNSELFTQ